MSSSLKKYWWVFIFLAPFLAIALATFQIFYGVNLWEYEGEQVTFEISPGESFSKINYRLGKNDLIYSTKLFHRYCQLKGLMTRFQVGKYRIEPGTSMLELIDQLSLGKSIQTTVTVPEGKNLFEIAALVEDAKICPEKEFIQLAKDPDTASKLAVPGKRLEGYLYPETYRFSEGFPCFEVIKKMVETFREKTNDLDFESQSLSEREIIILASIVEKETGASFERPMIAGVFHNRLKKGMRIQSDPTTIYGIYEQFNGNLKKKHLLEKTPYNTYKISGLPIGPICNPGIEAIKATLNPDKHKYLYFVSQNDGTHVFAETYKQHLKNVEFYQKNYSNRKGKSWRDLKK